MSGWRRLEPTRCFWRMDEPGDPDFYLEFQLEAGDRVRLSGWWPYLLAQRVFRKPPHLVIDPAEAGGWRLLANVGLSRLFRVFGRRFDDRLRHLLWVEVCSGNPWEPQIRLDAHAPLHITLPGQPAPDASGRGSGREARTDKLH